MLAFALFAVPAHAQDAATAAALRDKALIGHVAWAALVYLIADSDIDFRALGAAAQ